MELPATEIMGWMEYFEIYPFTQDREDARVALLAQTIANMSGKSLKKTMDIGMFIPNWLNDTESTTQRTLEQQKVADEAFAAKLIGMQTLARIN